MSDDPRVQSAIAALRRCGYLPSFREATLARQFLAMYDAVRACDQTAENAAYVAAVAQRVNAELDASPTNAAHTASAEYLQPLRLNVTKEWCETAAHREVGDATIGPPASVRADPQWLDEAANAARDAWVNDRPRSDWRVVARAVLAFAESKTND